MRISSISYSQKKTHRVRSVITTLIVIMLIVAMAIIVLSVYTGWKLTHPERRSLPVFSSNIVPDYTNISFKDINDELTLKGWFFEVPSSTKTLILAHGYGQNRLPYGEDSLPLIKYIISQGYNVLTFDFRNSGESEGKITTIGLYEKNDLLGAINYAKKLGSQQIVLFGFSMGASTSIVAAAESEDVTAVIADSPFADMQSYLDENLNVWSKLPSFPFNYTTCLAMKLIEGVDPTEFSPKTSIANVYPRPMLLIHSKDDMSIPIKNSYELKTAGLNVALWITEGVGHIGSYNGMRDTYLEKIGAFLSTIPTEQDEQAE